MSYSVLKTRYDIKIKVEFDLNGGTTISESEKTYTLGQKYVSLPTATKTDFIMAGWFTDPINGTKMTTESDVDFRITKLYAHFQQMSNYTAFNVTTTSSYKDFGFYSLTKKSSSDSVFIDWGDGTLEEITSYSQIYHTYSSVGNFIVKVSDDITQFCLSNISSTYYNKVRYTFKSIQSWSTSLGNSLPQNCFYYCSSMNSLQNLGNVTSIGTYCFFYCTSLTSFSGLGNITSLTDYSFYSCSGITSLNTLPSSVTSYRQYCLSYTGVSDLSRIRSTDTLNSYCFAYMNSLINLSTLTPRSSLPTHCFFYTNINVADLTNWTSLTSIPAQCFQNCNHLNLVKLPSSVTSIGNYAFSWNDYGQLTADFSNTKITSLPNNCFYYSDNIKEIKLPNTLRSIGNYAFYRCYNSYFTSISLPSSLTSIGDYAFYYCRYLKEISCYAENAPTVYSNTFGNGNECYTGRMSYSSGTNTLYVNNPNNYKTSYWNSVLLDSSKCGYHAQSLNPYDLTYGRMEGLSSWYLSTGHEINPEVSVYSSNGTLLTENVEWKKELSNNIDVGTARISAVGISPYIGCLEKTFKIVGEEPKMIELQYIESSKTQYIDTGVVPTSNTKCEIDLQPLGVTGGFILGCLKVDCQNTWRFFNHQGNIYFDLDGRIAGSTLGANERALITLGNNYVNKNGERVLTGTTKSVITGKPTIILFGGYNISTVSMSEIGIKIYSCKFYESDILTLDLIPVKDTDGVVCMYDKVSDQFFYNKGTGDFIAGPEKAT